MAKSERAELARAQDRFRFVSDLHNTQGHQLKSSRCKTELAGRLIKRDPGTAEALIAVTELPRGSAPAAYRHWPHWRSAQCIKMATEFIGRPGCIFVRLLPHKV
jgi:hypothetical protein